MQTNLTKTRSLDSRQKSFVLESLNSICEELDLTKTQRKRIEDSYNVVGDWLASSDDKILSDAQIYAQGSVALRTTVKPLESDEYDVDLICYLPNANNCTRDEVLNAVKNRLMQHETYRKKLSPLARGYRINYAGEFDLDITPAREHELTDLRAGQAIWVPDKRENWKQSNPKGMIGWFEEATTKRPQIKRLMEKMDSIRAEGTVERIPDQDFKAPLNRVIQILKRHRDEWAFNTSKNYTDHKPISVLITTLASRAYMDVSANENVYEDDLDILIDVIELMPSYIEINQLSGEAKVLNPTMPEENYAEKWNRLKDDEGKKYRDAFYAWHSNVLQSFETLADQQNKGIDQYFDRLSENFGEYPVSKVRDKYIDNLNQARLTGTLSTTVGTGMLTANDDFVSNDTVSPKRNTFYGEDKSVPNVSIKSNTFYGE